MNRRDHAQFIAQAREELARRSTLSTHGLGRIDRLLANLAPKQLAVVTSEEPRQAIDGSRQSGKSHALASRLLYTGFKRRCHSTYVAPTSKSARNALWSKFYALNDHYRLGIEMHEAAFRARFPSGSDINFEGAHDRARVQRLRGDTITGDLLADEGAFYHDSLLRELIGPVASAMFLTTRQSIIVASSPGPQRRGRMFDICHDHSGSWKHTNFTVYDNPAIKDPERALRELREANAWTEASPAYQREGLGLWVDDASHNVYDLTELNLIDRMPEGPWTTIMIVDFGKNDQSAIAIAGWREHDPALYVLHVEGHSDLDIEDVAQLAMPLSEKWNPIGYYGDAGGGGAQHMDYLRRRHGLPMQPVAKKQNYKAAAIRELNADMRRGHYKVLRTSPLVEQMQSLQWDPTAIGEKEHPVMANDLCDVAGVYAYVQAKHYRAEQKIAPDPQLGSSQYWSLWSDAGLRSAIANAERYHRELEEAEEERAFLTGQET